MTQSNTSGFGAAVEQAQRSVVRVAGGRCHTTSGTVFSEDLLVTSQRALGDHEDVLVVTADQTEHKAEVVGSDPSTDVAVLRVQGGLLPPQFRAHDSLQVGEYSLALGRPGKSIRASLRIIGLLAEDVRTPHGGRLERYIETDRGFPDGFAGGPLIDAQGAVIGMNTPALIRGADLAVPHVTLTRVVQELVTHGRVRRGYLGVSTQPIRLPAQLRQALGQRSGALVLDTEADGPAQKAGLVLGDVIVGLDGEQIRGPRELAGALASKLGSAVKLDIVRAGQVTSLSVTPGERG